MNLGRPAMVSIGNSDQIPLPSADADVAVPLVEEHGSIHDAAILKFFVASAKLYRIAQQILLSFYSDETADQAQGYEPYLEGNTSVFRFERDLRQWCDEIPEELELGASRIQGQGDGHRNMTFHRQAVVLRIRYVSCPRPGKSQALMN